MPIFQRLRETHPYRLLLIATLAAVALVQVVAMAVRANFSGCAPAISGPPPGYRTRHRKVPA